MTESPLTEAQPTSLERYFNIDPLELTDQDLDVIVQHLRAQRHNFLQKEAAPKAPRKTKANANLSLGDLGL